MKLIKNTHRFKGNPGGVAALMVGALAFAVICQPASADNVHFHCLDGTACGAAATVTDTSNPPNFNVQWAGGGDKSGDLLLVFLDPEANGMLSSPIAVTGTGENGAVSTTATLFSSIAWTNTHQDLASYLNSLVPGAGPNNPQPNYGPSYVYVADLGSQVLCHNGTGNAGSCTALDQLDLTTSDLPLDTYILGFLGVTTAAHGNHPASTTWYATPNSETVLVDGSPNTPPPPATPEPSSLALLGTGVLGLAGMVRRKFRS